ncbi:MAG: PepSY domain-containing protein [Bacteroidota bacterium]|nr:PepSY domain-containing protein [Bacteroidota bacterium]
MSAAFVGLEMILFFKKYHKWLGIVLSIFVILFSVSGIILNHRELFSAIDLSRKVMPAEYRYKNWNNSAVKGTVKSDDNNILIYGNIGIWKTDTAFSEFDDFNAGFPKGIDNRKICKLFNDAHGNLFAGTFFGLYKYDIIKELWQKIELPVHNQRITDIIEKDNNLLVITRSHLLQTEDCKKFKVLTLPAPENFDNKISLFKTLWVIHSGEIYGEIGKLLVDLVGLIFIFLTITGLIYFINTYKIKNRLEEKKDFASLKKTNKWNLKWHNKIGWITIILLIITTLTGVFLRPPLLIAIANSKVDKIPYTELDSPNPWFDKLRRIYYDKEIDRYIIATLDGFYYSDDNFKSELRKYKTQPPASVMGVNVLQKVGSNKYLVGSFEGLFEWQPASGNIIDHITKEKYIKPEIKGPPIGEYLVTGMSKDFRNNEIYFTYNKGAISKNEKIGFAEMPEEIQRQPISLWNIALEVHTARIYAFFVGNFYFLIIPLAGLLILFILISGFIVWYKLHQR